MNRRDTILVAVLINTGLLVILFITALKPNFTIENAPLPLAAREETKSSSASNGRASIDQVDHILSQYVKQEKREEQRELIQTTGMAATVGNLVGEEKKGSDKGFLESRLGKKDCTEIVVKQGDVLEKIARAHGTTVEEIMQLNQMKTSKLQVGQILQVPEGRASQGSSQNASQNRPQHISNMADKLVQDSLPKEIKYYTVKAGDNPWTIAVKNHIKVEELLKLNGLDEEKAKKLKPGDQLRIK